MPVSEIVPGVFIGDFAAAQDYKLLTSHGITSIVAAMRQHYDCPTNFDILRVQVDDLPSSIIITSFPATIAFMRGALEKNTAVLVHCAAGVSRSSTLVAAYLMAEQKIPAAAAVDMIRKVKPDVEPSSTFHDQLELWERSGYVWDPASKPEQRHFLMDDMAARVRDGVSPALVLADYPSASLSTEDPAVTAPSSIPLQERVIQQAASQGASGAAVGGQSQLVSSQGSTGVKIRCKMCRRELAARVNVLSHERGMGQHAFAPRRRDINVYRQEAEKHRSELEIEDRRLVAERLANEAAGIATPLVPEAATPSVEAKVPRRTQQISMAVPVPVVAPPPILKLASSVVGLRISMPFQPNNARTPVARPPVMRPKAPLATPNNSAPAVATTSASPSVITPAVAPASILESITPIVDAVSGPTSVEGPLLPSHLCSSYFVEPLSWMSETLESGVLAGKVVCPNAKCGAKLGSFDWAGLQCSCGAWVCPGFALNVAKVDEVNPTDTPVLRKLFAPE